MSNENENKGVSAETAAALSAVNPRPITGSGFSASIADAPAHKPFNNHTKGRAIPLQYPDVKTATLAGEQKSIASRLTWEDAEYLAHLWNSYYPTRNLIERLIEDATDLHTEAMDWRKHCRTQKECSEDNDRNHWQNMEEVATIRIDKMQETLAEARAFLNKNVKP